MFEESFQVEQEFEKDELREVIISKFRGLAKQYFQEDVLQETDYLKLIKESSQFYSFDLPEEFNELFIKYEEAPLFWIYRSPIMLYLENFYKTSISQGGGQNYYKIIKDFYTKWLLNKHESEKKYFAASAVNFFEKKSNKNNFLNLVFQSVILAYDKHLMNPSKAVELLERSKELINEQKLSDEVRDELRYLVLLYQGFYHLKQNENESALRSFIDALSVKPFGITAKFYHSLSLVVVKDEFFPADTINDFYSFDISRIAYAIDKNNLSMMSYFIRYAVIKNFFYYPELSQSYTVFFDFLRDIKNTAEYDLGWLKANLNNLKNLNMKEYYDEKAVSNISCLEKLFQSYFKDENILFTGITGKLYQKFKQTVEIIVNGIKQKYYGEAEEKLGVFGNELQYKISDLQILSKAHEEQKVKFKEKMKRTIAAVEKRAAENIAYLEERIENIQLESGYDPKSSFKNAMTYNIILSFTVFLMGGCAEYSNNFMTDVTKYHEFFTTVILTGFKWALIAFSVGLIISFAVAGLTILEGAGQKKKLLQMINRIKDDKDYQIEYYKKEAERKEKDSDERFNRNIEEKKKYIESLKVEKAAEEKKLKEVAEKQISEESKPILSLIP